ncbi:MAG: membrane protein insertion efficiency factor YidD [candidate division NC10 bacterium]|nr:membrane protein insertion efficiency factor YidD [candidate division NC10 bacterium]
MRKNRHADLGLARLSLKAIALYRRFVSPLFPPACRFVPTCSAYAEEAIRRHGLVPGIILSVGRLLRCHPLHPGGIDPVR